MGVSKHDDKCGIMEEGKENKRKIPRYQPREKVNFPRPCNMTNTREKWKERMENGKEKERGQGRRADKSNANSHLLLCKDAADGRAWPGLTCKWKAGPSLSPETARQGRLVAMRTGK